MRTVQQVDVVLQRVKTLKPKTDNFMRMGPPPQLLICLHGSMDCQFQGNPFSFGIEIWLPKSFPFQAPLVFVAPNQGQRLRASALVDPAGRVIHSYLSYWHTRPNSTLIEMMNYLHQAFCQEPPIFLDNQNQPQSFGTAQAKKVTTEVTATDILRLKSELRAKLESRYDSLQQELSIEMDRILAENTMLCDGETKIKKALGNLRAENHKVIEEIEQSKARIESLQDMVIELQAGGELEIDKLVIPQGPVSRQIVNEIVKEQTLEDCIYALSKAFEKKSLNLPTYIRLVREQSKKAFMSKALLLKIRQQFPIEQ